MKKLSKVILWYLCLAVVIGCIGLGVNYVWGSFPAIISILVPISMIINGYVAEWEDNRPGGLYYVEKNDSEEK